MERFSNLTTSTGTNSTKFYMVKGSTLNMYFTIVLSSQKRPVHWVKTKTMFVIGAKLNNW